MHAIRLVGVGDRGEEAGQIDCLLGDLRTSWESYRAVIPIPTFCTESGKVMKDVQRKAEIKSEPSYMFAKDVFDR